MRKRGSQKLVVLFTVMAMLLSLCAQGDPVSAAKKATLKQKKMTITKGKTKKITIKNKKKQRKYIFSTSKKKIATVSKKGVVKGKEVGKAVITVKEKYKVKKKNKKRVVGKVKVTVMAKKKPNTTDNSNQTATPVPGSQKPTVTVTSTLEPTATATNTPKPTPTAVPTPTPTPRPDTPNTNANFYVSEVGDDITGDGSWQKPFRSLKRAKEAVRSLDKSSGDIVVEIENGFYPVDDTITFTSEDSGNDKCTIHYQAYEGAKPVISGGDRLTSQWEIAGEVNWLKDGLVAYKTPLKRDSKLRAIYVNGERASMTTRSKKPKGGFGKYKVTKGQADWAWNGRSSGLYEGTCFAESVGLPADTRNPQNIELESGSTWAKQVVCAERLAKDADGNTEVYLQMPYGALAQNLGWNTQYNPKTTNDISNVFEWLSKAGEFYFDQQNSMLYYIPREGENLDSAEIIIPRLETIVEMRGDTPRADYVENITFSGLTFAYTDYNLYELEGSSGYASVQGAIVLTKFADENQHNDIYRSYDVPPAAIHMNSARNINILDGEIRHTGYLGVHMENDVNDLELTGNYIAKTGGAGVVVGHPTHVYENDTNIHQVKSTAAGPDKEKFKAGTESVPKNINITNNYLLENCYFFPGNSPITTFFTYNLQVLHNFVYKCSYSGMSIGWGWCNFDGYDGADSQLPGVPTETSKNNHVNYNRVEEICSLLQDAGGIYTLGKQGNDDWTEYSEMSFNYINAKRKRQTANGSKMINGFHPDEGRAYIKFDSNVVTNIIRNVYELNDWRRKHDMIVTNGFSNTDRSETTAPNCSLDQYVNSNYIWPLKGYETVLYSGLEDKYVGMVGEDVIPATDYELASNVRLSAGQKLPRRGLLSENDTVWLAPANSDLKFAEGDTMTKAKGNEKSMDIPKASGEYKLYIVYADGRVSDPSTCTLYVGEPTDIANVSDGENVNVSKLRPLVLELSDSSKTYTLNNEVVTSGYKIETAGIWTLKAGNKTITFTTSVTDANRILNDNVTVESEGEVIFTDVLSDSTKTIWLAPSGLSAFDENDPTMSKAAGNSKSMKAPKEPGRYILTIVDSQGGILSQSDAFVTVE